MKNSILILFCLTSSSFIFAQDICESMLTSDLAKLENDLSAIENTRDSYRNFSIKLNTTNKQLAACADNTDGDLTIQRTKLAELEALFKEKQAALVASLPIDIETFYSKFSYAQKKFANFPIGNLQSFYDSTIINRQNLEFILTYYSHPYTFDSEGDKNRYEGKINLVISEYKAISELFNSERWISTFEHYYKSATETNDQDAKRKRLADMENDLVYWQKLLFPNSKKLKGYLARVRAAK